MHERTDQSTSDVDNLVARLGGRGGLHYQEILHQQAATRVAARWPLLREVDQGIVISAAARVDGA